GKQPTRFRRSGPPPDLHLAISGWTLRPIESLQVGGWRSLAARTVRDREAPGSNPGPPTNFEFETRDFRHCLEPTGHSRGTDSSGSRHLWPLEATILAPIWTRAVALGSPPACRRTVLNNQDRKAPVQKSRAASLQETQGDSIAAVSQIPGELSHIVSSFIEVVGSTVSSKDGCRQGN